MRAAVEKIGPAVLEVVTAKGSGQFVIEYHEGKFQRAKQHKTL